MISWPSLTTSRIGVDFEMRSGEGAWRFVALAASRDHRHRRDHRARGRDRDHDHDRDLAPPPPPTAAAIVTPALARLRGARNGLARLAHREARQVAEVVVARFGDGLRARRRHGFRVAFGVGGLRFGLRVRFFRGLGLRIFVFVVFFGGGFGLRRDVAE